MATVDDRVVSMAFENSKFESGVRTTLSSLDKLKAALKFGDAGKGLQGISTAAKKTDLSPITRGLDAINAKFGALRVAGVAVLSSIAVNASQAGMQLVKSFTLDPVIGGLHEYEGQIQSIQTILANTQAAGTNLKDVNKALAELNTYADKTIYNFGQMTKNIGTFTAAGVDLKTATASIKGIANLAALSGSSADQAATAMYQLSQAISAGRVSLQDWNSVVNAGMGGSVFQRALANTAVAMGELDEKALSLEGKMKNVKIEGQSFRESIMAAPGKQSWLTGDVLTNTLQQLSGELSKAELKAQGFSDAQVKAIQKQAKAAVDAATTVKTFSQLMDTTKEALGSGWAKTWQIIFGDFGEAKRLFTGLSNAISGFVGDSADARNSVLQDWKDLGGRTLLIQSLKEAFQALGRILDPIKEAFRDIFPAKTGKDLLNLTDRFHDFVQVLKISGETQDNIKRTFRGFFAVLDIGKEIVSGIFSGIGRMFSALGEGSGGVLDLTGNIGDLIVHFRNWLKEGDKIKNFFLALGDVLAVPIKLIGALAGGLASIFSTGDSSAGDDLGAMGSGLEKAGKGASAATAAMDAFFDVLEKIGNVVEPIFDKLGEAFHGLPDAIGDALSSANYDSVFQIIQTTLIGGIFLAIKKAIGGGLSLDFGGGILSNLTGSLDALRGSLVAIQGNIKANTMLQIGIAVAALAGAVAILSTIDPEKLSTAMAAVAAGLGQLMGAMAIMTKISTGGILGAAAFSGMATGIVILAVALNVLALALFSISRLSWEELLKGLAGIGGLLLMLSLATKPLSAAGPGMVAAGLGITALAIGLNILAGAVLIFGKMDLGEMTQGLLGMTAALVGIGLAVKLIPPSILLIGPGLIAVGIALTAIGAAVKIFASMDIGQMAKGLLGVGGALGVIAAAVAFMPPTLPLTAAGLILVGIALNGIAVAIGIMGGMDVSTLAKGIIAIGAALIVLAGGLTLMIAAMPGAAALAISAAALAVLVPLIGILGTMNWGTILKGLGAMVLSIMALSVAGAAAAPGLTLLGGALIALGLGLTLVSAAVYLLVQGLVKLAGPGAQGIGVVIAAFTAFVALLPKIIIDFVKGLVQILAEIAKIAPAIVESAVKIVEALVDGLIDLAPKMGEAAIAIVGAFLKVIRQKVPDFIRTGFVIFMALLKGIEQNIGKIVKTVGTIIVKFLRALTSKLPELVTAGANALAALLSGIAKNLAKVVKAAADVVVKFIKAIATNLPRVVKAGLDIPLKLIKGVGNKFPQIVKAGGEAVAKFIRGIGSAARKVVTAGFETATRFIQAVAKKLPKLADDAADAVIDMINAMADVLRNREDELVQAMFNLGMAIIQGLIDGLTSIATDLYDKAAEIVGKVKDIAGDVAGFFGVGSPSKLMHFLGKNIVVGMINGLESQRLPLSRAADSTFAVVAGISKKAEKLRNDPAFSNALLTMFSLPMQGIDQTLGQVDQAFSDMIGQINTRLDETQGKINTLKHQREQSSKEIKKLKARRKELKKGEEGKKQRKELKQIEKALGKENDVVKKANKSLEKLRGLRDTLLSGKTFMQTGLEKEKADMKAWVDLLAIQEEKLENAKTDLENAKQAREDFRESTKDTFSELPEIVTEDANQVKLSGKEQLANYMEALKKQAEATKKYKETLAKLTDETGAKIDETTYQKLLEMGVGGQEFADALLAGGDTAINGLKGLDTNLINEATGLANNAASVLHDEGVKTAKALVDGLATLNPDSVENIKKAMGELADVMIKAIKKKLKIKSPSEAFAEMGKFTVLGMAKGMQRSKQKVADAVGGVSKDALNAMKQKMKLVSKAVEDNINPNPTITPILDLTDVQNGSKSLQDMMNVVPISAAASYGRASAISASELAARIAQQEELAKLAGTQFNQYNYSPEALSAIDIYRQTRTLLATAKPVLP